jgi:phospholipase/carboxylesterase
MKRERIADLDCVLAGGVDGDGGGDDPMVVLMHGFGAGGDDLVAVADELDVPAGTRWVFPAGPLEMPAIYGDARAWWMIELERIQRELARGGAADRAAEVPEGLTEARRQVRALLDALARDRGRRDGRTVLGGFSQGAMVATDAAIVGALPLAGLVVWSGTLIAEREWRPRRRRWPVAASCRAGHRSSRHVPACARDWPPARPPPRQWPEARTRAHVSSRPMPQQRSSPGPAPHPGARQTAFIGLMLAGSPARMKSITGVQSSISRFLRAIGHDEQLVASDAGLPGASRFRIVSACIRRVAARPYGRFAIP